MKKNEYIEYVSRKDPFLDDLVKKTLTDSRFREMVVDFLMNSEDIMTYYHSYVILKKGIEKSPEIFYQYWNDFSALLKRENSYFRNYGMDLITGLTPVDSENLFDELIEDFYKQLDDEKISTKKYCIVHSGEIIKHKPEFAQDIINKIVHSLRFNNNTDKHQNFLVAAFIEIVSANSKKIIFSDELEEFLILVKKNTSSKKIKKGINLLFDLYKGL